MAYAPDKGHHRANRRQYPAKVCLETGLLRNGRALRRHIAAFYCQHFPADAIAAT
jgi:hypothetical protein